MRDACLQGVSQFDIERQDRLDVGKDRLDHLGRDVFAFWPRCKALHRLEILLYDRLD